MSRPGSNDPGENDGRIAPELRLLNARRFGGQYSLTADELDALLSSGHYRKSLGSPPHAAHYRRSLDDGSCLHLIVEDGRASMHRDRFDPHRDPVSLGSHLATEARSESAAVVASACYVVKLLAR